MVDLFAVACISFIVSGYKHGGRGRGVAASRWTK